MVTIQYYSSNNGNASYNGINLEVPEVPDVPETLFSDCARTAHGPETVELAVNDSEQPYLVTLCLDFSQIKLRMVRRVTGTYRASNQLSASPPTVSNVHLLR